ncbi:MAG: DNA mismatch repair endonuclease MutL [Oscillospiraceae bacterium]
MPTINILSPHVADLIAAGEVVERPASVVKELVENAIDAGSKNITIELRHGGLTFIRVTDDGCGMSPEDAGVCFLRHATSKLRDEHGLEAIGTLGFRGEALAAISAVSRIEMTTREKSAETGVAMTVEAGDIITMRELGCPAGTVMTVRDLFYNTPARLKFVKSDRAESAQCIAVTLRCALAHPEISVKCVRDGKEEFFTPGDGKLLSANYAVLGREMATSMLPCFGENDGVRVEGFVSSPRGGRGNRAQQFFFVNGRSIHSLALQTALENAYKNTLLVGKYPACTLEISLSCAAVDVNVHPTKAEVKFSDEKKVFDAVYYAVLSALRQEKPSAEIRLSPSTERVVSEKKAQEDASEPKEDYRILSAEEYHDKYLSGGYAPPQIYRPKQERKYSLSDSVTLGGAAACPLREPRRQAAAFSEPAGQKPGQVPVARSPAAESAESVPQEPDILGQPENETILPSIPEFSVIGEAMDTYILVQRGDALIFIDKHAAHERMIFDSLKKNGSHLMSQTLLEPIVFRPGQETMSLLLENAEKLSDLGFEAEQFGESELIIRAIPDSIDPAEAVSALEELSGELSGEMTDAILHTIACKAAIKAGRSSPKRERERIAEHVLMGEVKYCPHGRPVSFTLTKKELDKQFKRIV